MPPAANSRKLSIASPASLRSHPPILRIRRPHALRPVLRFQPRHVIGGNGVHLCFYIDAVNFGGIQAKDLCLYPVGQRFEAESFLQFVGDLQPAESLDLPLRAAPPDRIGAPQNMILPESVDHQPE